MKLSVIIPSRNESVMLSITVRSVLEELKAVPGGGEVIVVDNSDEDIWKVISTVNVSPLSLQYVEDGSVRLIRQPYASLYSAREHGIQASKGEYVCNLDAHMIIGHNSLRDLVAFMDQAGPTVGQAFAPVGWISQHECMARHDIRTDEGSIFGNWGRTYDKPTKICWNFGFKTFRKEMHDAVGGYGFFARDRLSWGGGEFYMAIKPWLLGYENWAVPCSPHFHIGPFSDGVERLGYHYRTYSSSGKGKTGIGVLAAFYALAGEDGKEEALKTQKALKQYGIDVERDWPEARRLAEADWEWLKARQVLPFTEFLKKRPWMEGWNEDRWTSWKPWLALAERKVQDLNDLPRVPS